jgi:uncharacterized protein YodC (DUF2158 family)
MFKRGDTVKLKSGGPVMTVTNVGKDMADEEKVWVTWFNDKGELKQSSFEPETLEPASPKPP